MLWRPFAVLEVIPDLPVCYQTYTMRARSRGFRRLRPPLPPPLFPALARPILETAEVHLNLHQWNCHFFNISERNAIKANLWMQSYYHFTCEWKAIIIFLFRYTFCFCKSSVSPLALLLKRFILLNFFLCGRPDWLTNILPISLWHGRPRQWRRLAIWASGLGHSVALVDYVNYQTPLKE